MTLTGRQYTITAGEHEATIAEVGAGLRTYTHRGQDVTCRYDADELPPKGCGMTLAPWPNRIRDGRYTFDGVDYQLPISEPEFHNASHGLGRWARWELVEQAEDLVRLRLDVVPQKGYPFEVRAEVQYSFRGEHGLTVELSGTNFGRSRAPFGTGNHPYLSAHGHRLDDVRLRVPAAARLVVDDVKIPVGHEPVEGSVYDLRGDEPLGARRFDDCFTDLTPASEDTIAELRSPSGGARVWASAGYRYVQVYTVDELTPGQPGIAIEPMTCAPDAFNSGDGLMVLEPGQSWSGRWGITPKTDA